MAWNPPRNDVKTNPEPTGNLLTYVYNQLSDRVVRTMSDDEGRFAVVTEKSVVVAKKETYGNIVSCHRKAAVAAANTDKKLVMYLHDAGKFYEFNARDVVLNPSFVNEKAHAVMSNFKIGTGTPIDRDRI